jgi:hypothetical protein
MAAATLAREELGAPAEPPEQASKERAEAELRLLLGEDEYAAAAAAGAAMTLDEAVDYALANVD